MKGHKWKKIKKIPLNVRWHKKKGKGSLSMFKNKMPQIKVKEIKDPFKFKMPHKKIKNYKDPFKCLNIKCNKKL